MNTKISEVQAVSAARMAQRAPVSTTEHGPLPTATALPDKSSTLIIGVPPFWS
jgi:hypothetical protein